MKICSLVLYYYFTLVHFQLLLYTPFCLISIVHVGFCINTLLYFIIIIIFIYFGVWVFFTRAFLLLVDVVFFLFLHWCLLFFLLYLKLFLSILFVVSWPYSYFRIFFFNSKFYLLIIPNGSLSELFGSKMFLLIF